MSGVGSSPALATYETSQVLLAGVSGGFSRGSPVFAPPTDWPVKRESKRGGVLRAFKWRQYYLCNLSIAKQFHDSDDLVVPQAFDDLTNFVFIFTRLGTLTISSCNYFTLKPILNEGSSMGYYIHKARNAVSLFYWGHGISNSYSIYC